MQDFIKGSLKTLVQYLDQYTTFYKRKIPLSGLRHVRRLLQKLKGMLTSIPIMQSPDWSLPFEIMCDASDYVVRVVLGQCKENNYCVIYYASKTLNSAQMNSSITEKELFTIVFALDKFWSYLIGYKIVIFTDNATLIYLLAKKDAKARLLM